MNKTSIIIVSYNTFSYTQLCIESIRQYTKRGTYEIIVVDNASTDQTVSWLRQQPDVHCIYNRKNVGFPQGCNQGMAKAKGSELLLLNSDTIVTPRWLEQMKQALYSDQKIGAVGCVTNFCSNSQTVDAPYETLGEMFAFAEKYNRTDPTKWQRKLTLVGYCFLLKREVYEQIGALDEAFNIGNGEDDDYSLRIWLAGYELRLCVDTFIHHFGSCSFKAATELGKKGLSKKYEEVIIKNMAYLKNKWGLSEEYKNIHNIMFRLPEAIQQKSRILVLDCGAGEDLFFLERCYPGVYLEGLTVYPGEWQLAKRAFKVQLCADLEAEACAKLQGLYDYIILTPVTAAFRDMAAVVRKLLAYVAPGGSIYYPGNERYIVVQKDT